MTSHAYTEKALVEEATMEVLGRPRLDHGVGGRRDLRPPGDTRPDLAPRGGPHRAPPRRPPAAEPGRDRRDAIDAALDELLGDRVAMGPAAANREVHRLLTEGVKVTVKDDHTGHDEPRTLRVIDWEQPATTTSSPSSSSPCTGRSTTASPMSSCS